METMPLLELKWHESLPMLPSSPNYGRLNGMNDPPFCPNFLPFFKRFNRVGLWLLRKGQVQGDCPDRHPHHPCCLQAGPFGVFLAADLSPHLPAPRRVKPEAEPLAGLLHRLLLLLCKICGGCCRLRKDGGFREWLQSSLIPPGMGFCWL